MKPAFVTLKNGKQIHYRRIGSGPPLIMLHASPQCSEALLPAAGYFSSLCTCLALDTPGYGYSDGLDKPTPTIGDYAEVLMEAVGQLGIEQFYLYGVATGSQIAIEIGKRYPDRVKFLMLDSNGHVSDEERTEILDGYFPSVVPTPGGGHLQTYWEMCRSLFVAFPWTSGKIKHAFPMPLPPPAVIHSALMRYLRAGEGYAKAYSTAFHIEKRDHLDGLDVPTVMTRWESSLVVSIADDLISMGLPECVRVLYAGPGVDTRYQIQVDALKKQIDDCRLPDISSFPKPLALDGHLNSTYFYLDGFQVHAKFSRGGSERPIIFLHDVFRSTQQFEDFASTLRRTRPVYLMDLPCHGLSSSLSKNNEITLSELAAPIAQILNDEGLDDCDIVGIGLGAAIACAISEARPVHNLHIIAPVSFTDPEQAEYLKNGITDLTPQSDGTHLVRAWNLVRGKVLYHPWYDARGSARLDRDANLKPALLHNKTVDLLKTGENYPALEKTYISIDWQEIYEGLTAPYTVWSSLSEIKL